jgi:hypothetical protein
VHRPPHIEHLIRVEMLGHLSTPSVSQ